MKTEKQIRDGLKECRKVIDWGRSKGPCPFDKDGKRGCCAECSLPSALEWVLGNSKTGSKNGQGRLIDAMGGKK